MSTNNCQFCGCEVGHLPACPGTEVEMLKAALAREYEQTRQARAEIQRLRGALELAGDPHRLAKQRGIEWPEDGGYEDFARYYYPELIAALVNHAFGALQATESKTP